MAEKRIPERHEIPDSDKWDLAPLFASDDTWESLFETVQKEIELYSSYTGRLAESVAVFKSAIEFHLAQSRSVEKLYTYAHLKSDEDKANSHYLGLYQRAISLYTRAGEQSSFLIPEIQALPDDVIGAYREAPDIEEYGFFLEKILRYRPHTLDPKTEQILAMSQEMAQGAQQVFGQLDNVDITFGSLSDASGNVMELSHGNFITFLTNPDRSIRETAFFQYYAAYEAHKHTLAATLAQSLKKDVFFARVRNFDNCRRASLFGDNIPDAVYDNLVETVRGNLEPLFTYLRLRRRTLGLESLRIFDTYVPIVPDIDFHMSYDEAVDTCVEALAPLGGEYTGLLRDGLAGGWVDRYENRGKRSGAYSSGCYESPPYILMNYEAGSINSLFTLIHEAGHSMHSYLSRKHRPYVDHDYTIFVAEVASTFNELLLGRFLLDRYRDNPAMRAYILNREIDNIRATLFRQTMFAEFETIMHETAEQGQPLTVEGMTETYGQLLSVYFGDTLEIDGVLALECLRIPHFYSPFYVYKYATGISAAIALVRKVLEEGVSARDRYVDFLKLGGSKFPLSELVDAGVDMGSPEPIQEAIAHFSARVDQLSEML